MFDNPTCSTCIFKSQAVKFLSVDEMSHMEQNCAITELRQGDTIFKQGMFSSNIIYLKHGIVKLHIDGPLKEQIIKIAKGPTYLGLPTTFEEKYYRYSATCIEEASACFIKKDAFMQFAHENGKFAYEIIIELCRDELNIFNKCISKSQKNVRGRIAEALIFFMKEIYNNNSFKLPLTRSEFGDYIDATRENISRSLTELHKDKIITLKGRNIQIINEKQLSLISKTG